MCYFAPAHVLLFLWSHKVSGLAGCTLRSQSASSIQTALWAVARYPPLPPPSPCRRLQHQPSSSSSSSMVIIYLKKSVRFFSRPRGFPSLPSGFPPHPTSCQTRITSHSQWRRRENDRRQRPQHHPSPPSPHPHLRRSSQRSSALPVSAMATRATLGHLQFALPTSPTC